MDSWMAVPLRSAPQREAGGVSLEISLSIATGMQLHNLTLRRMLWVDGWKHLALDVIFKEISQLLKLNHRVTVCTQWKKKKKKKQAKQYIPATQKNLKGVMLSGKGGSQKMICCMLPLTGTLEMTGVQRSSSGKGWWPEVKELVGREGALPVSGEHETVLSLACAPMDLHK